MPTLGTQNISTSYPQLLKTFGTGGLDGTLQVVTDGDNTSSALSVSTSGVASTGSMSVTGTATVGTLQVGASGPSLTAVTFATAAYAGATVLDIDHATTGSNVSTGTLAASGVVLGDMVIGNINSIGSTTGATPAGLLQDFRIESAGVLRFTIFNSTQTTGTIPAGTIFATALRFTA